MSDFPDSHQNSKSDISDCSLCSSQLPRLKEIIQGEKIILHHIKKPTTLAKHKELFPELLYHQFSLNLTILRGTYYNSQLSPFWIDQGHPLYRKKKPSSFPPVTSLQFIWENLSNCIMSFDTANIVIFKWYTRMPHQEDNMFIKYIDR